MSQIYGSQVFPWAVSVDGSGYATSYRNLETNFGDGYEQVSGDGINTEMRTWDVALMRRAWHEIRAAYDWLDSRKGRIPFYFIPEDSGIPVLVRSVGDISVSFDGSQLASLRAKFKEWRGT